MEEKELYERALKKWGIEAQVSMAIEEMAELTVELCHSLRQNKFVAPTKVLEELADVQIMVEQLTLIFSSEIFDGQARKEEFEVYRRQKLQKLKMYLD